MMVSSIVIKSTTNISFIKIEIDVKTGKMVMRRAIYNVSSEELLEEIKDNHRVLLPCKIVHPVATFYVPCEWDEEAIENYTQALVDELYLMDNNLPGCKNIEQIEKSFNLELVLL